MNRDRCRPLLLLLLGLLTGCQTYEYHLMEPAAHRARLGKQTHIVPSPPVEYRLVEVDKRIVLQVVNPQDTAINLLGDKSYLVDPTGLTHPLQSKTIAPHSYISLVLPPAPNIVYLPPPAFSIGFGFGGPYGPYPYSYYRSGIYYDDFFYSPSSSFLHVYPADYWAWKEGDVRMHLGYSMTNTLSEHDFLFRRQKAERPR